MREDCIYHIDLVGKLRIPNLGLEKIQEKIRNLKTNPNFTNFISEYVEINKNGEIEIYCESEISTEISDEDLIESLEEIERAIGGFLDGSTIEMKIEVPLNEKAWVKEGFQWDLARHEKDSYFEEGYEDWCNPEWEE